MRKTVAFKEFIRMIFQLFQMIINLVSFVGGLFM